MFDRLLDDWSGVHTTLQGMFLANREKAGNDNSHGLRDHVINFSNTILTELVTLHTETLSKAAFAFYVCEMHDSEMLQEDALGWGSR